MVSPTSTANLRQDILDILAAAVMAVDPHRAILATVERSGNRLRIGSEVFDLGALDRIFVVGAGKAGAPMTYARSDRSSLTLRSGQRFTAFPIEPAPRR